VSGATVSGKGLSAAAAMTIILMAGSQRIRRDRHATQRDRGCESDQSFFVKHVILLLWFKELIREYAGNAGSPQRVARQTDTFACLTTMRVALIACAWCAILHSFRRGKGLQ
jgi:hypothetical protein